MPWNNEHMLTDADGNLIPQVWDPSQNKFVPYEAKVQLSGTLTELEQVRELLEDMLDKDFATQTTLAAVSAKLADLESKLATIKANQLSGDQKVQLSGHIQEFAVASWDDLPPDSVPVGSIAILIGTDDIRQTDGKEWIPL